MLVFFVLLMIAAFGLLGLIFLIAILPPWLNAVEKISKKKAEKWLKKREEEKVPKPIYLSCPRCGLSFGDPLGQYQKEY